MPTTKITLNDFQTVVHLGVTNEERAQKQKVSWYLVIFNEQLPKACLTDELSDTICYEEISDLLIKVSESKAYKLIEHLCYEAYLCIKEKYNTKIILKIHKVKPPIINLYGGTEFIINDLESIKEE